MRITRNRGHFIFLCEGCHQFHAIDCRTAVYAEDKEQNPSLIPRSHKDYFIVHRQNACIFRILNGEIYYLKGTYHLFEGFSLKLLDETEWHKINHLH